MNPLTMREREVLRLLATGKTKKEIGVALNISEHTAKYHTSQILGKLRCRNATGAVVQALKDDLIRLEELAFPAGVSLKKES